MYNESQLEISYSWWMKVEMLLMYYANIDCSFSDRMLCYVQICISEYKCSSWIAAWCIYESAVNFFIFWLANHDLECISHLHVIPQIIIQYIPRIKHMVHSIFLWLSNGWFYPYFSGLLHCQCGLSNPEKCGCIDHTNSTWGHFY